MCRIIQPEQLKPGDIVLFVYDEEPKPKGLYNRAKWGFFSMITRHIGKATNSKYTHAAICYDSETLVHAAKIWTPVKKDRIRDVVAYSKHAAVFRSSWAFGGNRVNKLQLFLDRIVEEKAGYDSWGAFRYEARKEQHLRTLNERLEAYFSSQRTAALSDKKSYFCSELVGASLCAIGAIQPSAAVVYNPITTSPADLGNDPTFGDFVGYLVPSNSTVIPNDDEFYGKSLLPAELGGIDYSA